MRPPVRAAAAALAALPALAALGLVLRHGVNVLWMDEWEIAPLFLAAARGELGLDDLLAQHNESRKLFPRLLFLLLGRLTGWNTVAEMLLSQVLLACTALAIHHLGLRTGAPRRAAFQTPLAALLLYTPAQYWNFLLGIQVVVFLPPACLACALLLALSRAPLAWKLAGTAVLCTVATYSFANGMLCWALVPPLLIAAEGAALRRRPLAAGLWCGVGAANVLVYFWDYTRPAHHPSPLEALQAPGRLLVGGLAFLSTPFTVGAQPLAVATLAGAALLGLLAAVSVYSARERSDAALRRGALTWGALAGYAVLSAALATLGRVGFGAEALLEPRYASFALFLPLAGVYWVPLCLDHATARGRLGLTRRRSAALCAALASALLVLHLNACRVALGGSETFERVMLQAKAAVLLVDHFLAPGFETLVHPRPELVRERARELRRLGLLSPPPFEEDFLARADPELHRQHGRLERVARSADGWLHLAGWSRLPAKGRPGDSVVIACEPPGERAAVCGLAFPSRDGRWRARVRPTESDVALGLFTLDAECACLYRFR